LNLIGVKMENSSLVSRRSFLRRGLVCVSAVSAVATYSGVVQLAQAEGDLKALSTEDPMAKALGYVTDSSKVDSAELTKKGQPDASKQNCSFCVLFKDGGRSVAGADGEYGTCALFQNGLVNSKGWCQSWAANPALPK
jgi:hypothetical protein